jgi:hypothetical protein
MGRKSKEIGKETKELTIKIYEEGKAHAQLSNDTSDILNTYRFIVLWTK